MKWTKKRWQRGLMFLGLPVLAASGLFFLPKVHAFGPFHGRHGHRAESAEQVQKHLSRRIEWMLDEVDASDAQRKQVDAIVARTAPQLFQLMKEGRELRSELKDALLAPELDTARVESARKELDALTDRMTDVGVNTLLEIAQVLTPEQRKQIGEHLADLHR